MGRCNVFATVGVGAGIVPGDRHGPAPLALLQLLEKARGVIDVPGGIEHRPHRVELVAVIVVIDLHAAEIDELDAPVPHGIEVRHRVGHVPGKHRLAFSAQRIRVQRPSTPGLGQPYRIENAERNSIKPGRTRHFALTGASIVRPHLGGSRGLTTSLRDVSEVTGESEYVNLSTVYLAVWNVLFMIGVAPQDESNAYANAFARVRQNLQLTR